MTKLRWFCKMRRMQKTISATALAIAVVIAASFLCAPRDVQADNAPDWLRAAAQDKLPEYPKDTVAVILLDEQQTIVKDNGEIETRHRRAYKLLRPEARERFGGVSVNFDDQTKLSLLKAWTIMPDGRQIEMKEKDAVEIGDVGSYELYNDKHLKFLKFQEANPGSVVGYEYVQRHRPFVFEDNWSFQYLVPCRRARFSLQIPAGWEFTN